MTEQELIAAEARRQSRAQGDTVRPPIIRSPDKPIIGAAHGIKPKDPANAARAVEFHARWHGQAEALIQIWR